MRVAPFLLAILLAASGCSEEQEERLFTLLDEDRTHVTFENTVHDRPEFNIFDYLYFYDGGGVAVGDVNNDGLDDLFLTGNLVADRLYLNEGELAFRDVTESAGVAGEEGSWSTGVTMADVDGDGWLDIYVCRVNYGPMQGRNRLYINNQDNTFTEQAEAFGLDFEGLATQAAFFDYDLDGDLDLYLLNHSVHSRASFTSAWRRIIDAPDGDRLYRNDGGRFTNVTSDAGIYSSALGYGLGLAVSDVDQDGWPDVYAGNDFHENDYLYFNNGDGTFSERLQYVIGHTSRSSMGNDVADFNNDGRPDIVSLDMLPADLPTYRKSGGPDPDDLAEIKRNFGYAPQYARNTLQLNRGFDEQGQPLFSEIGFFAGIHATDWSWAGLFADLDNDGWKDLYVTNGILRRPNDLDYVDHVSRPDIQRVLNDGTADEQLAVARRMPAVDLSNYAFRNNGDLTFSNHAGAWGLDTPGFSHGAAYGDLDNDGDLDLVVNDVNRPARIYRNNLREQGGGSYVSFVLEGDGANTSGIGTKIYAHAGGTVHYLEQSPTRGFQSSVSHVLHVGLGAAERIDSLVVIWPDGCFERRTNVPVDRRLTLRQRDAAGSYSYRRERTAFPPLRDVTSDLALDFAHRENEYADFKDQPLLPHKLSTQGPALAVGDVDADGLDDLYLGGAQGQAGRLFLQRASGFVPVERPFAEDREHEDVDAAFFDADGDGDLDLYVVSGGGQPPSGHPALRDRLYVNDGRGQFSRADGRLPDVLDDGCCVAPADFDADGDADLFVGSRSVPGRYGMAPASRLLENDGTGTFRDVTAEKADALMQAGMVTDALWADVDGSGSPDLIVVGEWMPVTILRNEGGSLRDAVQEMGLAETGGWWRSIGAADFDGDGDVDLVAGNQGANTPFRLSESSPLELLVGDFDGDGRTDPVIAERRVEGLFSWARRDELLAQMPGLRQEIPTHAAYAEVDLQDLFGASALDESVRRPVHTFQSSYFENLGAGGFRRRALPLEVQWSPAMDVVAEDVDEDGHSDLFVAQNFFGADTKQGRYDAGYGVLLIGDGTGAFEAVSFDASGFVVRGESREAGIVRMGGGRRALVIARTNDRPQVFLLEPG